ncbi:helix-turn-helix transcriptional regulator [Dongia sp.]|uniref:helix-turn-helix transcriptional regulator n=1 Tax=Dongia sp. TaxID=1977262 RepID=UPI0034A2843B
MAMQSARSIPILITEDEAAALLSVSPKTLQGWRWHGKGPKYVKIGRCVRYDRNIILDYIADNARASTTANEN